jgi:molybdate transport system substrate-binding protein
MDKYLKITMEINNLRIFKIKLLASISKKTFITVIVCFNLLVSCSEKKAVINIAVASNFENTLKKIVKKYQILRPNITINIIAGSSGVLANHVVNKAPYDLFLSADVNKAEYVYTNNQTLEKPVIYAIGKLALWIPLFDKSKKCIERLNEVDTLVIANPKTAPYGSVAAIIMAKHKIKVKKLVHAANISQSFLYTQDKFAQAGFVSYSMLKGNLQGCQQLFDHRALSQAMILLDDNAKEIYQYILSEEIQSLISNSGYTSQIYNQL